MFVLKLWIAVMCIGVFLGLAQFVFSIRGLMFAVVILGFVSIIEWLSKRKAD